MHENPSLQSVAAPAARAEQSPWAELDAADSDSTSAPSLTQSEYEADQLDLKSRRAAVTVYLFGFGGTVVAGALFPLAILCVGLIASGGRLPDVGDFLGFAFMGAIVGGITAALAGCIVFPLVLVIQEIAKLRRWSALFASCAGGWSGFASVIVLMLQGPVIRDDLTPAIAIAGGAMLLGQLGAGWAASRADRNRRAATPAFGAEKRRQFPLRQLFGITTSVAVTVVIVSSLPLSRIVFSMTIVAAAVQASLVGAYLLVRKGLRRIR